MQKLASKTDNELIELILDHENQPAFSCIIERYRNNCRHILFGICRGDMDLVEEAEQEVYISLGNALGKFRKESLFSTFFFRLVRNKGIDTVRKSGRLREHSLSAMEERGEEIPAQTNGPADELLLKEEFKALWNILDQLKEEERTLIILKDLDGLSLEEISSVFKKPLGTVKSKLHRARVKAVKLGRKGASS